MEILDCTLRDGGYYTNWDFRKSLVDVYVESFNSLPVEYLEVGYRSKPLDGYLGEFFYLPLYVLERIKKSTTKKLVVILNEKDVRKEDAGELLESCVGLIDLVRIAIDPKNFERSIELARAIKSMGFKVGMNVMYMSTWKDQTEFLERLSEVNGVADYFYMVDSFGGVYPEDVKEIYELVESKVDVPIGFHGHNNLELALINTLTAIECGASIVDATITGMGRGAGNLKTELLLTALNAKGHLDFDFNALSKVVDSFSSLQKEYEWGTNLPYMVSGANSLPQKQVMEWVSKRYYSFNSIIRALTNQSRGVKDNRQLKKFDFSKTQNYSKVLIIGGGPSAVRHSSALHQFLRLNPDMALIHASSKNALSFQSIQNDQYFCLVGNEGHRLEEVFGSVSHVKGMCILPPFPRKMGTYIPNLLEDKSFELEKVDFTDSFSDSHTALALQTAIELGVKEVFISGYDGYSESAVGQKEQELFKENELLFEAGVKAMKVNFISITPTKYTQVEQSTVYSYL